jgi:hypothetical protein
VTTGHDVAEMFRALSASLRPSSPFVARLAAGVADEPDVAELVLAAPPTQRTPLLLLNVVHSLVLDDPTSELAAYYPTVTEPARASHPFPVFAEFCREYRAEIEARVATRSTQTNEVGRCALFLPALGLIAADVGAPLALVDVGTSAGLNLQLDHFAYRYLGDDTGEVRTVGGESPVLLECGTRGPVPVPATIPAVAARIGVDRAPIDLSDPAARRWLTACVWPDQPHRFHRLEAAIELALEHPPEIVTADAVGGLRLAVDRAGRGGHPVVLNSWVLSYLTAPQRAEYLAELGRIGAERDLSWVYAEDPAQTAGLPYPPDARHDTTVLMLVTWRSGTVRVRHLADCHPHGKWLHWVGREVA